MTTRFSDQAEREKAVNEQLVVTEQQIGKAVEWWTSILLSGIRAIGLPSETEITTGQIDVFKSALRKLLIGKAPGIESRLFTDYGPGGLLDQAAKEADIPVLAFPLKTDMWFHPDGRVEVGRGHAAPWKEI